MLRTLARGLAQQIRKEQLSVSWYLHSTPPTQKTLVLTGPHGTGKSTLLQMCSQAYRTPPLSNFHLYIPLQPQERPEEGKAEAPAKANKEVIHPVTTSLAAVTDFLVRLEEEALTPRMQVAYKEVLLNTIKQLLWKLEEPLPVPEDEYEAKQGAESRQLLLQEFLKSSNKRLVEAKLPLRISGISEQELTAVVRHCTPSLSFQIIALAIMTSGREEGPGELLAPLIVNIANALGKELMALDPSLLPFLVVMESVQSACIDQAGLYFLTYFLKALLKSQEHFHCVLESTVLVSEPFKLIVDNPDKFLLAQVFELTKKEVGDFIQSRKMTMSESDKEIIWKTTKGTQELTGQILQEVEEGGKVSQVCQDYVSRMTATLNTQLSKQGMPEVPNSASIMHIQKMELIELRALAYFLSHIMLEDAEVEMSTEDFYENGVVQQLCLMRFCYYNIETKRLRIENALLRQALLNTDMWKILAAPTQQFKNKACYKKALELGKEQLNQD